MLGIPHPYLTADLPGVGGSIKERLEDFIVEEVPLYTPCDQGEHTYFEIEKTDLSTPEALERLHVHIAGIEFGPRGERRHLPLRESRFRYRELLRALKDCQVSGWVVCESPAMEDDALLLQRCYRRLR